MFNQAITEPQPVVPACSDSFFFLRFAIAESTMLIGQIGYPQYNIIAAIATPEGELYSTSDPSRLCPGHWKCWVASAEGERFEVIWWPVQPKAIPIEHKNLVLRATVYIDGVEVEQGILKPRDWLAGRHGWINGQQADSSTLRHFQWGSRELLDDKNKPKKKIDPKNLNTIRVVVEWGTQPRLRTRKIPIAQRNWSPVRARPSDIKFDNMSAATLGDSSPHKADPRRPPFRPAPGLNPRTFLFQYASEDWIETQGIVLKDHASDEPIFPKEPKYTKR
ncbi:unnamed protein product [Rhizoctonia solani]|uniref:Uncharacterized protein n=1 Tax=Rhizoctonia solani TaxID=456999 RepID=A0A8H3H6Q1_9AGAM|nr:unnamed protein product [Rhizoctonia solani]